MVAVAPTLIVDNMSFATVNPKDNGLLADRAFAHIRDLVAAGRLGPGDRVNELEIATALGISRGPVREAIQRLASAGLLVSEPNVGSRIVSIDATLVRQLYEVREALESMAAGLAAERMDAAERAVLVATLDQHEAAMNAGGSGNYPYSNDDWDFHLRILAGAGNALAWRICGDELRDLFNLLRRQHGVGAGRARRALQEHRWIADAVVAGNADLAALLMSQHIRASRDNLLAALTNGRGPA